MQCYTLPMNTPDRLETEMLNLPPRDRERLALAAWESLEEADTWLADPATDPEGIALALSRDKEIDSGKVVPLTIEEFRKHIGVKAE